jgi:hypothetical protein
MKFRTKYTYQFLTEVLQDQLSSNLIKTNKINKIFYLHAN